MNVIDHYNPLSLSLSHLPGLLHGVTVGEKFGPAGVLTVLGVTPLMPRSFSTEARPRFTENVEHELRLDMPCRGVDGALK